MLENAIRESGSTSFYISDIEKDIKGYNYSIDTVKYFKEKYPDKKLYILIGADQVNKFHDWKDAKELSTLANVVYVTRPNEKIESANIELFNMTNIISTNPVDISSSEIRELKRINLPNSVLTYIEQNNLYFISKIKPYYDEKRFYHALEVAHLALNIARMNKVVNPEIVYAAGLLHDIAKNMEKDKMLEIMRQYYPDYIDLPYFSYHQFVGAYIAKNDFNINDDELLTAIMYHATGKAHMTVTGKIIYCADKIEPTRGFRSGPLIRSCLKNYYVGFLKVLAANKKYLLKHKEDISNKLTDECFSLYLGDKK